MSSSEKTRLNLAQKSFLLGVSGPMVSLIVALRLARITMMDDPPGGLAVVDLLLSDMSMGAAVTALSLALLSLPSRRKRIMIALQIFHVLWLVLEGAAHNFLLVTGSTLDWPLIVFAFQQFHHIWGMITVSTPASLQLQILGALILLMVLPWIIMRRIEHPTPDRPLPRWALAATCATCFGLAWVPPLAYPDQLLGRNTLLSIIATAGEQVLFNRNLGEGEGGREQAKPSRLVPREGAPRRDVVIILLESTNAWATTPYSPELATTPTLNEFARDALLARHAFAIVPHTSKALVASLCGTYPYLDIFVREAQPRGIPRRCLADLLREQGYETAFFQPATSFFEERYLLIANMGYEHFYGKEHLDGEGFESPQYFGYEDLAMVGPSEEWLANVPEDQNVLMTYLTLMPHHDYHVPSGWLGQWREDPKLNSYLSAVHYIDTVISEILALLERQGRREDALILILGDHGEAFGEHGRFLHNNILYQEGLHIPLLLAGPNIEPKPIEHPISQLDILPTLAHHSGFEIEGGTYPGADLTHIDPEVTRQFFGFCWLRDRCGSVVEWPYKYIHHFDAMPDELYNLEEDPNERLNLAPQEPERTKRLKADLLEWVRATRAQYR